MKDISRRDFLKHGLGLVTVGLTGPSIAALATRAADFEPRVPGKSRILVLVQLTGGNDGLNTVVPYSNPAYYKARPGIGIAADKVLSLNGELGLHPSMTRLAELFKQGNLAIIQGVGYPNPNRSHFRSIEIWHTAFPERIESTGWLGRYVDLYRFGNKQDIFPAVNVDPLLPRSLLSENTSVPSVSNINEFRFRTDPLYQQDRRAQIAAFNDIYKDFRLDRQFVELLRKTGVDADRASDYLHEMVRRYRGTAHYPNGAFGDGLKFIAQMITGGLNSPVFAVSLDGFDTHSNQLRVHAGLLQQFSDGLGAFYDDLRAHKLEDDIIVLAFSEFGRRVAENGGRGTDHGTAAPVFVVGSRVKGGLHGDTPSLTNLDSGDLKHGIDFRSVYATILDRWLQADSKQILGRSFDTVPFV